MTSVPIELQKKARGARPRYFDDPAIDKILSITLALAGEVAVLRDRLDTVERLAESGQSITRASVDGFEPDAGVREDRDVWRGRFLDVILRVVHQEREALEKGTQESGYDDAVAFVSNPENILNTMKATAATNAVTGAG